MTTIYVPKMLSSELTRFKDNNGNILLDKASDIVEIPCPDKSEIAKVDVKKPTPPLAQKKNEAIKNIVASYQSFCLNKRDDIELFTL